jgi:hypothetical protein
VSNKKYSNWKNGLTWPLKRVQKYFSFRIDFDPTVWIQPDYWCVKIVFGNGISAINFSLPPLTRMEI